MHDYNNFNKVPRSSEKEGASIIQKAVKNLEISKLPLRSGHGDKFKSTLFRDRCLDGIKQIID